MKPRDPAPPDLTRIETSAEPSRLLLVPAAIGFVLFFVPLPGFTIREQATVTLMLTAIPLLSFLPLWRLHTKQVVELTDDQIVVSNVGKRETDVSKIPLNRVSDIQGQGRRFSRQMFFWSVRQVSSVSVRTGSDRHWFGLCMRHDDARQLVKEIRRLAYRSQGGAVKPAAKAG